VPPGLTPWIGRWAIKTAGRPVSLELGFNSARRFRRAASFGH